MNLKYVFSGAAGLLTFAALCESLFQPLKLVGIKSEKPAFYLDNGKKDVKAYPVKSYGKGWSAVQISSDGATVRLKSSMKQILLMNLPLKNQSFSFSLWAAPETISSPYSAVLFNTTKPPCWGIRLSKAKPDGNYKVDVYYNWKIKGKPGGLMRTRGSHKLGEWHFYTITFDREKEIVRLYLDGQPAGSAKIPKETPAFNSTVSLSMNPAFFDGEISHLNFYPRVLTPEEISAEFQKNSKVLKVEK